MPIREPSEDPKSVKELERGLEATSGVRLQPAAETRALGDEERSSILPLGRPHPVYSATLADAAEGRALSAAELVSWRYFVTEEERVSQAAEVYRDPSDTHTFAGLNEGSFVEGTLAALEELENRDDVAAGDFEWRVLRIPALYVFAVWLKDKAGEEDLIVPLEPTHDALDADRVYGAKEFVEALIEPAKESLEMDRELEQA